MDKTVYSACGSDLMSDVLSFVKEQSLLLTGLTNHHVFGRQNCWMYLPLSLCEAKFPIVKL